MRQASSTLAIALPRITDIFVNLHSSHTDFALSVSFLLSSKIAIRDLEAIGVDVDRQKYHRGLFSVRGFEDLLPVKH